MTVRKKPSLEHKSASNDSGVSAANNSPLVFISHDTRDAELAEAFSDLLRKASSGALKSFCSSDKKGATGIPYGEEWYPTIMEKLDEASDVVCLLTKHSLDRPWILYEAGVAKGKLGKKVIGIALGIPFKDAVTGPFAQFQNNDGDVQSVVNLVLSLAKKIGLDPDNGTVTMLVNEFIARVTEITSATNKQGDENAETGESNSVTKLFEEVKVMFDALPSRIEHRIDPNFRRRKRRFHPMMFEEFLHMGNESKDPLLGFLMMVSMFKDDIPWLYEVGLEAYRSLKSAKTPAQRKHAIIDFDKAINMTVHPMMREYMDKSDDSYYMVKEIGHLSRHFLERFIDNTGDGNIDTIL